MDLLFIAFWNWLLRIEFYTWWFSGFITGSLLNIFIFFYRRKHSNISMVLFIVMILPLLITPFLSLAITPQYNISLPKYHLITFIIEAILGYVAIFMVFRNHAVKINKFYLKLFKKDYESNTDVREISDYLPTNVGEYNPEKYFKIGYIFLGLDKDKKPVYISYEDIIKVHMDVVGTTGAGKGVVICVILYQLIKLYKQVGVVIAPKEDKWAAHVLKKACDDANLPFLYINLNTGMPAQVNILKSATQGEIEELFSAGFGLAEKGKESDVYRIDDRFFSSEVARKASKLTNPTIGELYENLLKEMPDLHEKNKFFAGALREMAMLDTINAKEGLNIEEVITKGGIIYVDGSMLNSKIVKAQKMFVFRIMQLAKKRKNMLTDFKPIALFLDEFKYLISNITLQTLGAELGNGLHAILAHQSLNDLRGTSADLDADMVKGAVIDNTKIKLCYRQQDPKTIKEYYAEKSGTIQVQSEVKSYEADIGLTMLEQSERKTQQINRHFVDTNMLLNLPDRCAALYGLELTKLIFTSPIKVIANRATTTPHDCGESKAYYPDFKPKNVAEKAIDVD